MPKIIKCLSIIFISVLVWSPNTFSEEVMDIIFKDVSKYKDVEVIAVINTAKIRIRNPLKTNGEIIKLIGLKGKAFIKSKEKAQKNEYGFVINRKVDPTQPLEERAVKFVEELVIGKRVRLEFDKVKVADKYETLAYVFLLEDDTFVNSEILRQGYAQYQVRPPNTKYKKELREAYQEARREKRGLQSL